jgi:cell division protein FtsI/penicillin-binding protein 2
MLRNFRHAPVDPSLDLERALVASSNTWFGYLGLLMHRSLREGWGDRAIVDSSRREAAWPLEAVARSLGFGEPAVPLGAGVSGEMGRFPATVADDDAPLAARSIGQDEVTATPLGLALLLAAVATDGQVPAPRVSADVPVSRAPLLGPAASARLREALAEVVERGTAARAFADHPAPELVLGKTGSAQRIDPWGVSRTDAWFAGALLPPPQLRDASPVAVVVVLPGAGLGGSHAAELADRIGRDVLAAWGGVPEQIAAFR